MLPRLPLASLLSTLLTLAGFAASPLVLQPATLDHGDQTQQHDVLSRVTVTNTSDRTVRIVSVHSDCGCTVPQLDRTELGPGESTILHVRFETRTFAGPIRRTVTLTTDQGVATLPVSAHITPYRDWSIDHLPAVLPSSTPLTEARLDLRVLSRGERPGRLLSATTNAIWLRVELRPDDAPGAYLVTLTKTSDAPVGNHTVVVGVRTDSSHTPLLALQVAVPVASALQVSPHPVILPRVPVGKPGTVIVRLTGWTGDDPPHVEAAPATVRRLESPDPDGALTYELSFTSATAGTRSFPLRIRRGDTVELEVPVIARAAAPAAP